jgi:signal transduction histidine kinase
VVNAHGGTITFETETGVGTKFIVKLPQFVTGTPAEV